MYNETIVLIKKHTDTLVTQTKTKPREAFEFKMKKKQMETFSFSPPMNLSKEVKWLLALIFLEQRTPCLL